MCNEDMENLQEGPNKIGFSSFLFLLINFILFNFTILYWFCHISKWICHRYPCVPHPEPSSLLPPHTIPLGHPSAPAPSIRYHASKVKFYSSYEKTIGTKALTRLKEKEWGCLYRIIFWVLESHLILNNLTNMIA